jgi:pimeloyl-ACP methyl ester carboxylesterase
MAVTTRKIKTTHADIAVSETSGKGLPVLFIHGNSSCKEVFSGLLEGPIGESHRLIAIDLPGCGSSSDAIRPERTYSLPGLADAAIELLGAMGVERAAVFGWSLGGHVAMEMLTRFPGMIGLMVVGAPPIRCTLASIQEGFKPNPIVGLIGKEAFSEEEVEAFGAGTYGALFSKSLRAAVKRADGRLRRMTFENLLAGVPADERKGVEECDVPVALVNGANDPFVNLDYVGGLAYRNLWDNHCYVLRDAGHAVFLDAPEAFSAILKRFAEDMAQRGGKSGARKSKVAAA